MKRSLILAKITLSVLALLSASGCFQYPEGPIFTLQTRDERLAGTWLLTSATDQYGNDALSEFNKLTLTVIPSRSTENSWTIFENDSLISHGTYLFAEHEDVIVIQYSLFNGSHTPTQEFYSIKKLTDKYFYYQDKNSFTFHFQKY